MTKRNYAINHARNIRTNDTRRTEAYSQRSESFSTAKQRKYFIGLLMKCKEAGIEVPSYLREPAGRGGFAFAIDELRKLLGYETEESEFKTVMAHDCLGMHEKIVYTGKRTPKDENCVGCKDISKNMDSRKQLYPCCKCVKQSKFVEVNE